MVLLFILLFVLGAVWGSFLNVVIARLPKGQSIVFPSSHCPFCKHRLAVADLFPLVSFLLLKGRCRYCNEHIPLRYFWVELCSGIIFAMTASYFPLFWNYVFVVVFLSFLLVISFIDLETKEIPEILMVVGGVVALLYAIFEGRILSALGGALAAFLFFFLLARIAFLLYKQEALGFGDVEVGAMLGAFLGWPLIIYGIFVSYIFGAVISLTLIALKKVTFKDNIPFAPFLALGAFYTLFWG